MELKLKPALEYAFFLGLGMTLGCGYEHIGLGLIGGAILIELVVALYQRRWI